MKHLQVFSIFEQNAPVKHLDADKKAKLVGYLRHNSRYHAGKEDNELNLENVIYQGLIRGRYDTSKVALGADFVRKNNDAYRGIVDYLLRHKGGKHDAQQEWLGFTLNKSLRQKTNGKTYNYYVTFERTPENIGAFMRQVYKFHDMLDKLSEKLGICLSYKFGANLSHYFEDVDHLKVYFYDPVQSAAVTQAVEAFFSDHAIRLEPRNYTHGVDVDGDGSWGSMIAGKVTTLLTDLMKTHQDNFSGEQYYHWLLKAINTKYSFK